MNLQHTAPDDVVARLRRADRRRLGGACAGLAAVSYTHLTLPTNREV